MPECIHTVSLEALVNHGVNRIAVAIGVFDGVHLGHQLLLKRLKDMAERHNAAPVVLTFFPHPRQILFPNEPISLLVSNQKKLELIAAENIKSVVTLPFSKEFAELSADDFLTDCLFAPDLTITGICVGSAWRFGRGGEGGSDTIRRYADTHGFEFDPVEEFSLNSQTVSSTLIRRAVSGGLLEDAAEMLGRNYSLSGVVTHGAFDGTSVLACPTANISISDGIIPPNGVYAGRVKLEDRDYSAAISVGVSPTFADKQRSSSDIEVHILDFCGDLYGKFIEVEFIQYIREERCYSSSSELKKQIEKDLTVIRSITHADAS